MIPWFVAQGELLAEAAAEERRRLREGLDEALVPEQFFFEMHSVLCRRLRSVEPVLAALTELHLSFDARFSLEPELAAEATRIAVDHGLSGYDACYVAVAKLTGSVWLTADRAAHERVASLGLSRLLSDA